MDISQIIIMVFALLFAITVHEASHGWAAYKLGDPTAQVMGRITLNPIAHIDPIGTVLLPAVMIIMGMTPFGWAKPVPVNPLNFDNPKRDNLIVSLAGPLSNFTVAFIAFIALMLLKASAPSVAYAGTGNNPVASGLFLILYLTMLINVILAFFNLIPIPPLDGSGIVMGLLSDEAARKYELITPYGFLIVILLLMTGVISRFLYAIQLIINRIVFS